MKCALPSLLFWLVMTLVTPTLLFADTASSYQYDTFWCKYFNVIIKPFGGCEITPSVSTTVSETPSVFPIPMITETRPVDAVTKPATENFVYNNYPTTIIRETVPEFLIRQLIKAELNKNSLLTSNNNLSSSVDFASKAKLKALALLLDRQSESDADHVGDISRDIRNEIDAIISGDSSLELLTVTGTSTLEGTLAISGGAITLANFVPSVTTDTIYNSGGSLYWNGNLIAGGTVGTWDSSGSDIYRLTGNVGIGTTTPSHLLTVAGDINATGALRFNGSAGTTGMVLLSNGSSAPTWTSTSTMGLSSLFTNSSQLAALLSDEVGSGPTVFASSTMLTTPTIIAPTITGNATLANASTTNLTIATNAYLGTVRSGTWNGTAIGDAYLTKTGDWTGTLDSQEGTYYLGRANHTGTQTASTISDFSSTARGLLSSSATGLTYTSGTGDFSLTAGYNIPLSASTTEWATAYAMANPGGSDTQLQYNNAGVFGGMSGTSWDNTNRALTITGATLTANKPILDLSQTWNNAGVNFTGLKLNVAKTAAGASSKVFDFQVDSTSAMYLSAGTNSADLTIINGIGATRVYGYFNIFGGGYIGAPSTFWHDYTGLTTVSSGGGFGFSSSGAGNSPDVVLSRDAAANLALRNGTNAQTFRIYNTYASSTSYERGKLEWNGDVFKIGTEKGSGGGIARAMELQTDGVTALTIATTSYIGIGSTTPSAKLSVTGTGTTTGLLAQFADSANTPRMTILDNGNVGIGTTTPNGLFHLYKNNPVSNEVLFRVSTSDHSARFTVDEDGDVGISGTIGWPNDEYFSRGSASINVVAGLLNVASFFGGTNPTLSPGHFGVFQQNDTLPALGVRAHSTATSSLFQLNNSSNVGLSAFDYLGRLGIGTTTPAAKLSIIGSGTGAGQLAQFADSANAPRMMILDNGNIGIGTTTPSSKLQIYSTAWDSTEPMTSLINLDNTALESKGLYVQAGANNALSYIANFADYNANSKVIIQGDGKVGIGTTTPDTMLTVYNGAAASVSGQNVLKLQAASIGGTVGSGARLVFTSSGSVSGTETADIRSYTFGSSQTGLAFGTGYGAVTSKMVIDNSGNVGIGTTSPSRTLHVNGSVENSTLAEFQSLITNDGNYFDVGFRVNNSSWGDRNRAALRTYLSGNGGALGLLTANNISGSLIERVRITRDGYVGIGTDTPGYLLTVAGDINATGSLRFNGSAGTTGMVLLSNGSSAPTWTATSSLGILSGGTNGYLARWTAAGSLSSGILLDNGTVAGVNATNSTTTFLVQGNAGSASAFAVASSTGLSMFTINANGNVGIGTTSTPYKLTVDGSIAPSISNAYYLGDSNRLFSTAYISNIYSGYVVGPTTALFLANNENNDSYINVQETEMSFYSPQFDFMGGNVGIGTTTPTSELTVDGTIMASNLFGGATNLTVDANGNIIRDPSDVRLKTNITEIQNALDTVLALRGVRYEWRDKERFGNQVEIGFIAQEVDLLVPEVVSKGGDYWSLNTKNLVAVVVEAIQELYARLEENFAIDQDQSAEIEALRTRIEQLEAEKNSNPPAAQTDVVETVAGGVAPDGATDSNPEVSETGVGGGDIQVDIVTDNVIETFAPEAETEVISPEVPVEDGVAAS